MEIIGGASYFVIISNETSWFQFRQGIQEPTKRRFVVDVKAYPFEHHKDGAGILSNRVPILATNYR